MLSKPTSANITMRGLLLVILLTVSLLGASQMDATHVHLPDSGLECEMCAGSAPVDVALSSNVHWDILFALGLIVFSLITSLQVQVTSHYLARAPPLGCQ